MFLQHFFSYVILKFSWPGPSLNFFPLKNLIRMVDGLRWSLFFLSFSELLSCYVGSFGCLVWYHLFPEFFIITCAMVVYFDAWIKSFIPSLAFGQMVVGLNVLYVFVEL